MKKSKLLSLLSGIGCLALATGAVAQVNASAETTLGGVDVSSFRMEYGAGIRFKAGDPTYKNGIRFKATLADEAYEELEKLDGVNYGLLIIPADIVKANPLTIENLFGQNAVYCLEDPKLDGEETGCECTKQHVASVEYETLVDDSATDGVKNLRGSIVDILDSNITREFVGLGYIEYNGQYVLAANAKDDAGVEDVKNNTRSMAYVAQLAIEDGKDDSSNTIYNNYVKAYAESTSKFAYTVNHYLPDENGEYGEPVVEKAYGKLNTEVSATHILKSTVDGAAQDYTAYRLHEISSTSKAKGNLYANGRTVLNAYYVPMNTSFQTVVNNTGYFLLGANTNTEEKTKLEGATTAWHDTITLGGETKEGVVQINTTYADQWTAGKFNMCFKGSEYLKAVENGYSYIKLHIYIVADETVKELNLLSKNKSVATAKTGEWVDLIVPLAKLNQADTYLFGKSQTDFTKAAVEVYGAMGAFQYDSAVKAFLCTNSVNTNVTGLTTTDITYYIDEVSWGIDTKAPEITVSGVAEEMFEGTFTEPTVTVADDMALQSRLDSTVEKKLYKVDGETRTEVAFTDGAATLTKGSYVYVVTADDRIYTDVVGNVATKEVAFEVVEKQDVVITFDSLKNADGEDYIIKNPSREYTFNAEYLTAEELAAAIAAAEASDNGKNAYNDNPTETISPEGGAIKVTGGMIPVYTQGAYFNINLSQEQLALITEATAITIRLYAVIEEGTIANWDGKQGEADLLDGGANGAALAGIYRYTWTDVKIDVSSLSKSFISYFDGTTSMFFVNSNFGINENSAVVAYYINSITFDVTP